MKLRTRLFLWVGSLFFLFFIIAYFVETILVRKNIDRAESSLRSEISEVNAEKHKHLEEFLGIVIADFQGKVDSLLYRLEEKSFLEGRFFPSGSSYHHKVTWEASSELLLFNKWIDFLQNTMNERTLSVIIPNPLDLVEMQRHWIDENLSWMNRAHMGVNEMYLGIRVDSQMLREMSDPSVNLELQEQRNFYYFFDWKKLLNAKPIDLSNIDREELYGPMTAFTELFQKQYNSAIAYLQANRSKIENLSHAELKEWVYTQKYRRGKPVRKAPMKPKLYEGKDIIDSALVEQAFEQGFNYHTDHDRIDMIIWGMSPLWVTRILGSGPLSERAPVGACVVEEDLHKGEALFSQSVFFEDRIFQDREYVSHNVSQSGNRLVPSIALIYNPKNEILYFGNTLKFANSKDKGYLTLGVNIDRLAQELSVMSNQKAVLAYQGRIVSIYDENGKKLDRTKIKLPLSEMRQHSAGVFKLDGAKYYFANLEPFKSVDLHFYVFEPSEKAFAFVDYLKIQTKEVINKISLNMRMIAIVALLIGLFLLHNISKNMIKPIAQLAKATSTVGAGEFDKVDLPDVSKRRKDEIVSLVESFSQMLQGLREREKVRGVLNKFVSKEIAAEILKGEVHLGGEERVVSILFADIRSFTKMTENMAPHDVVDMLNQCMTKVTKVVDGAGGVIDKYVGDEAMALYGAPVAHPDSALRAVYSGIKMLEEMKAWNEQRQKDNLPQIELGIGIHTGNVLVGNMGAEDRLNYTVLGSNVNLAARLCGAAKVAELLITEETLNAQGVKEAVEVEKMEAHQFKGFTHETQIYRVTRLKDPNLHFESPTPENPTSS